jgi:phage shock protein A
MTLFAVGGTTVLVAVGVVIVLVLLFGRKGLSRIWAAGQGQANKASRSIWAADSVAVYQKQVDDSAEEIKEASKGLEQYRGLVSRIRRQVEADQKEVALWDIRARGFVSQNNDVKAADALANKKKAEQSLAENQAQLTSYETAYQANLKKVQYANKKIEEARQNASKLQAELRMSQAEAEIANLAQSFNVKTNGLNGLGEVQDEIQRQIDANRAKAQVAKDLGTDGLADIEAEESARVASAQDDLAKLKAEMGK